MAVDIDEGCVMNNSHKKYFLLSAILILAFTLFFIYKTPVSILKPFKETIAVTGIFFLLFYLSANLLIFRLQKENNSLRRKLEISLTTDDRTGLLNRTSFDGMVEGEISRTLRYDMTFSLALFNIDGLKMINEFFSREAGDTAIVGTGEFIREKIRDVDSLFYLDGGTYALILPNTALSGAFTLMSRLRQQLENANFDFKGQELAVTASFGVTEFDRKNDDAASIFNRVENLVLKAKKMGRNRVC